MHSDQISSRQHAPRKPFTPPTTDAQWLAYCTHSISEDLAAINDCFDRAVASSDWVLAHRITKELLKLADALISSSHQPRGSGRLSRSRR